MSSGIAKRDLRQTSQDVCPWNVRFSKELPDDSPFAVRDALGGRDARTLARELLGMAQEAFTAAFRGSPMRRAKLRGLLAKTVDVVPGDYVATPDPTDWRAAGDALRALGGEEATKGRSFWNDLLIAASCVRAGATRVTRNVDDFRRIRRLIPVAVVPRPVEAPAFGDARAR